VEPTKTNAYRPDVDGLRAIAVISVVLFHISKGLVPGGFAGVDIFFVISGYLITLLIYSQMQSGKFSLKDFYKRRINRIAPALFALIASVLVVGLIIFSPADLTRLVKSGLYASGGLSNIFFWRHYGSYFSFGVDEAPLLHTWSLGVEEQFYIIWPLGLWALTRIKSTYRFILIGIAMFATIAISALGVRMATSASYYLLPTRAFELLIGGALALFFSHSPRPLKRKESNMLSVLGGILLMGSLALLNDKVAFPGINAVYPCIGTAMLIAAGTNRNSWAARTLSCKPLVFFGLISYSLYLWHWPLIAFANYLDFPIRGLSAAAFFALSVFLGWLSWQFVEKPFRNSGHEMAFRAVTLRRFIAPAGAIGLFTILITQSSGLPSRFDPRVPEYESIILSAPNELRPKCHSPAFYYDRKPEASCVLGVVERDPTILMIGDSYANHFTGMVDVLAKADNVTVTDYTMDGCPPIKGMSFGNQVSLAEKCKARNEINYNYISSKGFKYVILSSSWSRVSSENDLDKLKAGLTESIAAIVAAGSKPIIIINNERTENANCPVRRLLSGSRTNCDKRQDEHQMRNELFAAVRTRFPELTFVDPNLAICSNGICHTMLGNVPLYRDGSHLNEHGSRAIGKALVEKHVHLVVQGDPMAQLP